jgi:hypothetical protein
VPGEQVDGNEWPDAVGSHKGRLVLRGEVAELLVDKRDVVGDCLVALNKQFQGCSNNQVRSGA